MNEKTVLYGVALIIVEELDPLTQLPLEGGIVGRITCAESLSFEPNLESGTTTNVICNKPNPATNMINPTVIATLSIDDVLIDYDVTLTDNQFDPVLMGLFSGATIIYDEETGAIVSMCSPMLSEGQNSRPFRMTVYVSEVQGSSITGYSVFTFNYCVGKYPSFDFEDAFYTPEFEIKAKEATLAGLPIWCWTQVDTLPGDTPDEPDEPEIIPDFAGQLLVNSGDFRTGSNTLNGITPRGGNTAITVEDEFLHVVNVSGQTAGMNVTFDVAAQTERINAGTNVILQIYAKGVIADTTKEIPLYFMDTQGTIDSASSATKVTISAADLKSDKYTAFSFNGELSNSIIPYEESYLLSLGEYNFNNGTALEDGDYIDIRWIVFKEMA